MKSSKTFSDRFKKIKWLIFTEIQDCKLTLDYIKLISPSDEKNFDNNPVKKLRDLVENSLIREFSPNVKEMKSFNLLVDTVTFNIQKKNLSYKATDFIEKKSLNSKEIDSCFDSQNLN